VRRHVCRAEPRTARARGRPWAQGPRPPRVPTRRAAKLRPKKPGAARPHAPSRAAQVRDGAFPESRYVSYAHMMLELTRSL